MANPIDHTNLDKSIDPAQDFYHFANGGWLRKHPIPDEFSRFGTFDKLREENRQIVNNLIQEVSTEGNIGGSHVARLVGDFYRTGMNTDRIELQSYNPIKSELQKIEELKDLSELPGIIAEFYALSIPILFYIYPAPDREDSNLVIANLYQGGMGLSDVDYYRNDDERSKEIREAYIVYISKMFMLIGLKKAEADDIAGRILQLESRLAHAGMRRIDMRDPHKTYNKHQVNDLVNKYSSSHWDTLLKNINIPVSFHVNVGQPDFFYEVNAMFTDVALEDWKHFLKWRVINSAANYLSNEFEEERFNFYGKFLSGKKTLQPRWKRVTSATEDALGEAIGKLFVAKYFPPEAKQRMLKLVDNLRKALGERISELEWMTGDTKSKALEKLKRIRVKIGYPDAWRSYQNLKLENHSYYDNYRDAAIFNLQYELSKIGKPVDRNEWHMTPQTVNAYYHPLLNEIVFPAGILQPPFFYQDADDAVNYGAIGVIIGHEMTHGFDDQGRKFDKEGNLKDWWTEEDARNFEEKSKVLVDQFNNIQVTKDLYADGQLSLGENIADLGGINIAFHALQKAWKENTPAEETDGFTPAQRFFLAYAHIWANNIREKEMIRLTKEDVHSLGINRVNGPLPNVPSFHTAFGIAKGSKMYLDAEERANIW